MRRLLLAAVAIAGVFGSGCGAGISGDAADTQKWTTALNGALEPIAHIEEMVDVGYSLQGAFGGRNKAWLSGKLWTDTDDPAVNRQTLDEAGRAIAEAFAENDAKSSWVNVSVVSKSGTPYPLEDLIGDGGTIDLDDLAEHYGVPRR